MNPLVMSALSRFKEPSSIARPAFRGEIKEASADTVKSKLDALQARTDIAIDTVDLNMKNFKMPLAGEGTMYCLQLKLGKQRGEAFIAVYPQGPAENHIYGEVFLYGQEHLRVRYQPKLIGMESEYVEYFDAQHQRNAQFPNDPAMKAKCSAFFKKIVDLAIAAKVQ